MTDGNFTLELLDDRQDADASCRPVGQLWLALANDGGVQASARSVTADRAA
jgi:hypothetical protein